MPGSHGRLLPLQTRVESTAAADRPDFKSGLAGGYRQTRGPAHRTGSATSRLGQRTAYPRAERRSHPAAPLDDVSPVIPSCFVAAW